MSIRLVWAVRFAMPVGPQLLASLQSLLISVLIARNSTVEEFGQFGVAFSFWAFSTGLIRSATSELYIFHTPVDSRNRRSASAPLAMAFGSALVASLLLMGASLAVPGFGAQLIWLAASIPFFVLQDSTRVLLISLSRAGTAVAIDGICAAAIALALLLVPWTTSPLVVQYLWTGLAALAGIVGLFCMHAQLSGADLRAWWRTTRLESSKYASEFLLTNALMPIAMIVTTAIVGQAGAAALRAAQMLFAPVTILARGVLVASANHARGAADAGQMKRVLRIAGMFALSLAVISTVLGLVLLATPVAVLEELVGSSATVVKAVVPAATLTTAALSIAMGAGLGLRAFHSIGRVIVAKTVSFPIALAAVVAGAMTLGAAGAQLGLGIGEAVHASWAWISLARGASGESGRTAERRDDSL